MQKLEKGSFSPFIPCDAAYSGGTFAISTLLKYLSYNFVAVSQTLWHYSFRSCSRCCLPKSRNHV